MIQRALTALQADAKQLTAVRHQFNHYYQQTINHGTVLYPHVTHTLATLAERHYPLAIVTNKPSQFIPALLQSLQIDRYFSLVLGGDDVVKQKPHPAPLYQVLATFGLKANELLFVGDSRNDILAARQATCPVAALSYGYNYGESIALSQPDHILDHFEQLLTVIESYYE